MRCLLIGIFSLFLYSTVLSQESAKVIQKVNSKKIFANERELNEWIALCKGDTAILVNSLALSRLDSLPSEKLVSSLYLIKSIALKKSSYRVKNSAVKLFLFTTKSKHSVVSTLSVKALCSFSGKYYDVTSIDSLSSLMNNDKLYSDAVLLTGYTDNPLFIERIKQQFPNSRSFTKQERWASYKALARLGDKESLDYCIQRISSMTLNDQVVDILYPDLIYIHKKEAFSVIIKALYSDEKLCSSTNPNSDQNIVCGYRLMELISPFIKNFPIKLLTSGDLDVKDYSKALKDVRDWFDKMKDSYEII